jgi:hypothetical protein
MDEEKRRMYDAQDKKDIFEVRNRRGTVHTVTRMHFEAYQNRDGLEIIKEIPVEKELKTKKKGK